MISGYVFVFVLMRMPVCSSTAPDGRDVTGPQ